MKSKRKLLRGSRLYVILDAGSIGQKRLFKVAGLLRKSRVDIVQYRDKHSQKNEILKRACRLRKIFSGSDTLFIINDYLDIAKIADSDGIHLGQKDISVNLARRVLGKNKVIGLSCHNFKEAIRAKKLGADYIGIGPIFPTPTKPGLKAIGCRIIKRVKEAVSLPFFPIGGINLDNLKLIKKCGASRVAVCRAVLKSINIRESCAKFKSFL
ncbi:MAG: thiamine phosphate synthase [Candidatus Omnitrophota bacterium]